MIRYAIILKRVNLDVKSKKISFLSFFFFPSSKNLEWGHTQNSDTGKMESRKSDKRMKKRTFFSLRKRGMRKKTAGEKHFCKDDIAI